MGSIIVLFILSVHTVLAVRSSISPEATCFKNRTMINSVPNVYASDKNKVVFLSEFKQDKLGSN